MHIIYFLIFLYGGIYTGVKPKRLRHDTKTWYNENYLRYFYLRHGYQRPPTFEEWKLNVSYQHTNVNIVCVCESV